MRRFPNNPDTLSFAPEFVIGLLALVFGTAFGAHKYVAQARFERLRQDGVHYVGSVVSSREVKQRRSSSSYFVTVRFAPANEEQVSAEIEVEPEAFIKYRVCNTGESWPVHYLV